MVGNLTAIPTIQGNEVFFQYHNTSIPLNRFMRRTIIDEVTEGDLQYVLQLLVPQNVSKQVISYVDGGSKMPRWELSNGSFQFQCDGRKSSVLWQKLLKVTLTDEQGNFVFQDDLLPYGQITIRMNRNLLEKEEKQPEPAIQKIPYKNNEVNIRNNTVFRTNNPNRSCTKCYFLNPGNICAVHRRLVNPDQTCSRFQPFRFYSGGSVTPK